MPFRFMLSGAKRGRLILEHNTAVLPSHVLKCFACGTAIPHAGILFKGMPVQASNFQSRLSTKQPSFQRLEKFLGRKTNIFNFMHFWSAAMRATQQVGAKHTLSRQDVLLLHLDIEGVEPDNRALWGVGGHAALSYLGFFLRPWGKGPQPASTGSPDP